MHRSADIRMAVVDILISKTFDASRDLPGRADVRHRRRHLRRRSSPSSSGWARGCSARGDRRARRSRSIDDGTRQDAGARAVVRRSSARSPASRPARRRDKVLLAPLPTDLTSLSAHPLVAEKLMPVLGPGALAVARARDRRVRARHRARRPRPHRLPSTRATRTSSTGSPARAHRPDPRQRPDRGRRARRHLQLDDADVLARLRHLGRLEHDRQRQLPQPAEHQGGLAPPDTAAVVPRAVGHLLQRRRAREPAAARAPRRPSSSPTAQPRLAASSDEVRRHLGRDAVRVLADRARADRGADPRRRRRCSSTSTRPDRGGRRRLGARRRQGDAAVPRDTRAPVRELSLPFLDARKRVAPLSRRSSTAAARRDPDHRGHRLGGLARPR